eukprot:CAMPEP_0184689488 /NCGR_PEP_ID=MMETSP0312-20130426/30683_1 /TAXON_ID=31354 /ORGANISM="Compsopogon coeruleus, Strain SAG 36.94" /LENGTH=507 /DNA_ID=CAMNT_0027146841 /DNA_START=1403 /DNA_END=2926 /DNA_ORIENTATION=-
MEELGRTGDDREELGSSGLPRLLGGRNLASALTGDARMLLRAVDTSRTAREWLFGNFHELDLVMDPNMINSGFGFSATMDYFGFRPTQTFEDLVVPRYYSDGWVLGYEFSPQKSMYLRDWHGGHLCHENQTGYASRFVFDMETGSCIYIATTTGTGQTFIARYIFSDLGLIDGFSCVNSNEELSLTGIPSKVVVSTRIRKDCVICVEQDIPCLCSEEQRRISFEPGMPLKYPSWGDFYNHMSRAPPMKGSGTVEVRSGPLPRNLLVMSRYRSHVSYGVNCLSLQLLKTMFLSDFGYGEYRVRAENLIHFSRPEADIPVLAPPRGIPIVVPSTWHTESDELAALPNPNSTGFQPPIPREFAEHPGSRDAINQADVTSLEKSSDPDLPSNTSLESSRPPASVQGSGSSTVAREKRCPICGAVFSQTGHMNQHIAIVHEKKRPFSCEECAVSYGTKSNLNRHYRMVHQSTKRFSCNFCAKGFSESTDLRRHLRSIHKQETGAGSDAAKNP